MKFSARLYLAILPLLVLLAFSLLSPRKIFAATQLQPNAFDFNLNKYIETKINNRQTTKTINVSVEEAIPNQTDVIMAGIMENIMPLSPQLAYTKPSAIPVLAQAMVTMYVNPPADGFAWVYDTLANAGLLAQPTYAQGIGFVGLAPLLPLWTIFRNISYAILIIIMVAIGFMVIFRTKIDPKTVISVQAALPKIILTLIIITFSYPIAGFLIDLMYLSMAILINVLATSLKGINPPLPAVLDFMTNPVQQQTEFITGGWGKLFVSVFSLNMLAALFEQFIKGSAVNTGLLSAFSVVGGLIGQSIGFGSIIGATSIVLPQVIVGVLAPSLIILFIIFLGLLFTFIRLTFLLLNSYIQVLISVILGPLLLLKEAIPGQSAFSEWIQNLIANLIVFPATVAIIYLSWILTAIAWRSNLWGAPLIPVGGGGDIGGQGNPLAILMGLGTIFLAPNLVASIKKVFHAKPALPITAGSAFAPVTGGAQTAMGAASQFYYMRQIFGGGEPGTSKGPFASLANLFPFFKQK